jgi:hypothetical protein
VPASRDFSETVQEIIPEDLLVATRRAAHAGRCATSRDGRTVPDLPGVGIAHVVGAQRQVVHEHPALCSAYAHAESFAR